MYLIVTCRTGPAIGQPPKKNPRSFLLTRGIDSNVNYEAAFVKNDSDEFNEPYLPARYREIVRKKKQRRLLKKIGMITVAVIAVIVVFTVLGGIFAGSPQPTPSPAPTAAPLQSTAAATTVATTLPAATPATTSVPTTVTTIQPTVNPAGTTTDMPEPVQTASANTYVTPSGDTSPKITDAQAKEIAKGAFPDLPAGDMTVELATTPDFGQVWKYTLSAGTTIEASGLVDAESGTVVTFNRTILPGGRPQNPVLTMEAARQIADSTVSSRYNGILSINLSDSRYLPLSTPGGNVAGSYRFIYNRIIQDYPCDADGFIVSVDAISGAITEYVQRWQTPETAFMIAEDAMVTRSDAVYTVQARANSLYPTSNAGFHLLSADIRWKDIHDPATTPRLSSIPLAWKIVFDDDIIRAKANPTPAIGWVDAQSGELLEITYRH